MTTPTSLPRPSAVAPLLYWLLVMTGLTGLAFVRKTGEGHLVTLWIGTILGVGLGQLLAWLRVRAWFLFVVMMGSLWLSVACLIPLLFMVVMTSSAGLDTLLFAFVPAAVCGYLSLSERGALIAFWFPAVLWMVAILDRPTGAAFDMKASAPFVVGLAGLFVAFVRARETRRVALWQTGSSLRLAEPRAPTVLVTSPMRTAGQVAWTALVGAGSLVLAVWIAPRLWQKDVQHAPPEAPTAVGATSGDGAPCCHAGKAEEVPREHVREYFPLIHPQDKPAARPCVVCSSDRAGDRVAQSGGGSGGGVHPAAPLPPPPPYPPAPPAEVAPVPRAPLAPPPAVKPLVPPPPPPPVAAAPPVPVPEPIDVTPSAAPGSPPRVHSSRPTVVVVVSSGSILPANPWRGALVLAIGFLALRAATRAIRRQLTVRHLRRPFWPETATQRVSNAWELVLIGLRDAGVHAMPGEQPTAFARRVGIAGVAACATILERMRHGVRLEPTDLEEMETAARDAYREARSKAGFGARAVSWVRWPLA